MTDIRKTIANLKELEARATQAPWVVGASVHGPDQAFVDWDRGMVIRQLDTVDADLIVAMRNALPELLQKLQELLPAKDGKLVTEWCSECRAEVSMYWDIKDAGYKAWCPYCGMPLMLCSECIDEHGDCGRRKDCDALKAQS